jgi:hypothetical protein
VNSHIFTESDQSEASDEDMEVAQDDIEIAADSEVDSNDDQATPPVVRPQRNRHAPRRLEDCEILPDNAVNNEGELIHFALLADAEPLNYKEAISN